MYLWSRNYLSNSNIINYYMYLLSNLIRKELNFLFLLSTLLFVSIDILSYNYIVLGQEDRREKDDDDDDRREKDDDVPFILPLPFP